MVSEVDKDGSEEIEFEEFCELMINQMYNDNPEEELVKLYEKFAVSNDEDTDKLIEASDLKAIFNEIGEPVTI